MLQLRETSDAFLQKLVEEHRSQRRKVGVGADGERAEEDGRRTAVDVLLSLQEAEPGYYTNDIIKSFILVRTIDDIKAFITSDFLLASELKPF